MCQKTTTITSLPVSVLECCKFDLGLCKLLTSVLLLQVLDEVGHLLFILEIFFLLRRLSWFGLLGVRTSAIAIYRDIMDCFFSLSPLRRTGDHLDL